MNIIREGMTTEFVQPDEGRKTKDEELALSLPKGRRTKDGGKFWRSSFGLSPPSSVLLNLLACGVMLVLALVFMSGGLGPGRVAAPMESLLVYPPWQANYPDVHPSLAGGDILLQQLPWHQWIGDELKAGRFPLWAPGPLGGYPFFAHYQPGALYPLSLLWALLPTGAGLGIIMVLRLWLAGLGMWGFLRAMRLHPAASLLGALGYMFSASMVDWLSWVGNSGVQLLIPWLAWAIYLWCAERKRGALVGLAALTALAILAGQPEILFMVGFTMGVWALGLTLGSLLRGRVRVETHSHASLPPDILPSVETHSHASLHARRRWAWQLGGLAGLAGLAVAAVVGLATGAIQLLPFAEALGLSASAAFRDTGTGLAVVHLDAGSILYWALPRTWGLIADGVLGGKDNPTEANSYIGLVALPGLVLAVVGVVRRRREINLSTMLPWVVTAVFAWLIAYDDTLGKLIRSLPGFKQSIGLRWIIIVAFSLLVVSAFGWDWLARRVEARASTEGWLPLRKMGALGGFGIGWLSLGVALLLAHLVGLWPAPDLGQQAGVWYAPTDSYRFYWIVWAIGLAMAIIGAMLVWASRWRGGRFIMPILLGALLVADLWRLLLGANPSAPADLYFPQTSFIKQLSATVPPTERIIAQDAVLPANTGLVYGFRDWRGQDVMISARAYQAAQFLSPSYINTVGDAYNMFMPDVNLLVAPALGIRYFILPQGINPNQPSTEDPGRPNFKRLAYKDGLGLWEAEGVPGFAYLSDYVWAVADEPGATHWMTSLTWQKIRAYASMVEAPASAVSSIKHDPAGSSPGSTTVRQYTPGHVLLDVNATRPGLLIVAESYYPGWRATLDGQPIEILRANYLSQGVVAPQGRHTVELKYEPDSFRNGALLSGLGLLGLLGLGLWAWRRGKRS